VRAKRLKKVDKTQDGKQDKNDRIQQMKDTTKLTLQASEQSWNSSEQRQ
jgi:hypothetical protein